MKVLLLNQAFYPDVVSSGQHLTDLALALRAAGHAVTVVTDARGYADPTQRFALREQWKGIVILRVPSIAAGKDKRWQRALRFSSYLVCCALRLLFLGRFDVVVAMTSPPLISWLGALWCRVRRARFVFWVMDLNPDEAVAAGWLRADSPVTMALQRFLRYGLDVADHIVVLDRFMRDRLERKGIESAKMSIVPPWSHDDDVSFTPEGRAAFRREHRFEGRFVVMYAGNHGPCNPLATLVDAMERFREHDDVVFCFMGGGSMFEKIRADVAQAALPNAVFLPYQPLDRLAMALSAADLHVVTMGNEFVGLIHPCKIYNVLRVRSAFMYIGPSSSHIADLMTEASSIPSAWAVRHGDVDGAARAVFAARDRHAGEAERLETPNEEFSKQTLLPRLVNLLAEVGDGVGPISPVMSRVSKGVEPR